MSTGDDIDNYLIEQGYGDMIDEFGSNTIPGIISSSPLITVIFPPEAELEPMNFDAVALQYVEYVGEAYVFFNSEMSGALMFDGYSYIELMILQ